MIRGKHAIQCMPCSSQIISEMLPEIHTMEKLDVFQIYNSFSSNVILLYSCLCIRNHSRRNFSKLAWYVHPKVPVWPHSFVSPSADSRGAVVSYWRKYVHEELGNRLGGLSLPKKSVVWLTDRPDMTLDIYRGRKTTTRKNRPQVQICV